VIRAWIVVFACLTWAFVRFLITKPWSD